MHFSPSRARARPIHLPPSRAPASPPQRASSAPPPSTGASADRTPKGFRPLNLLPTCNVCSSDIIKVKVDENSLAGFPVLKKTVYLFVYIGLVFGRLIIRRCILLEGKEHYNICCINLTKYSLTALALLDCTLGVTLVEIKLPSVSN